MSPKLSLFACSEASLLSLRSYIPDSADDQKLIAMVGSAQDVANDLTTNQPDLLIFEMRTGLKAEAAELEQAISSSPGTSVVLLSANQDPDFLLYAMRIGVREVVPMPLINGELGVSLARQFSRFSVQKAVKKSAEIISFIPAKGGSGATFLAANLGYALSLRNKRVLLIDCNFHFGDAALFVTEQVGTATIADLARDANRLDRSLLEASLTKITDDFSVLPSPSSPESAMDIQPQAIDKILQVASAMFDFIVIDASRVLNAATVRALDQSQMIYLVIQLTIPFLHDAKRLMVLLQSLDISRDKLSLIINRGEKGSEIGAAQIEKALGKAKHVEIPNSFKAVAYSINHGIPLLKSSPKDIVSRALEQLADVHCPRDKERTHWLRGLLN
jgi:pilus assembly protein CpaE